MRDEIWLSDPELQFQQVIVQKAVRFANSKRDKEVSNKKWAVGQYKMLKVLPPQTRYFVNDMGQIHARYRDNVIANETIWHAASVKTLEKAWQQISCVMQEVVLESSVPRDRVAQRVPKPASRGRVVKLSFPVEGWSRSFINGLSIDMTVQSFVPPTIDAFVAYAAVLLSSRPWRTRLSRCVQCDRYFLNPLNKPGRPRLVCSDRCNSDRGDPTAWKRSAKYRDRTRSLPVSSE